MTDWQHDSDVSQPKPHSNSQQNFIFRWLGRFYRWFKNLFAILGFVYTVGPIVLIWFLFHSSDTPSKHSKPTAKDAHRPQTLWVMLDRPIVEREARMGEELFRQIFGHEEGLYLPTIRTALRNASQDKQISDVQFIIDGLSGSPADLEELRLMITDLVSAGVVTQSWVSHLDNAALIIASATAKIHLNPVSEVSLPGPAFSMTYFGDALKKIGVEMQVIRTGKFKSAFEPFVANEPSLESREALGSVERSLRDLVIKSVATGRKKQDSEVFLWFKESFFTPAKAKELGIVDELAYVPYVDLESPTNITLDDYAGDDSIKARLVKGYTLKPDEGLALIEAVGEIVDSSADERAITPGEMEEELNWAQNEDNVKAVVLRISSPGGSAAASDFIWDRIRMLNEKKPVVISMGSMAASGGYYMASGGGHIIADPSTITGSIGVIGMIPNLDGLKDKFGVSFHTITQSNRAAVLGGKKMTSADQSYLQNTIDDVYRTFKSRVATSRKMSMERVEELAQGRIYTGMQAKENGLVDELGNLKDAFQYAKKAAGLDEKRLYPIHRYEGSQFSLGECFTSLSKLRKCVKRHGASVTSEAKLQLSKSLLGDKFGSLEKLNEAERKISKHEAMVILPVDVKL